MKNAITLTAMLVLAAPSFAQSYAGVGLSYNVLNGSIWQGQTDTAFDQEAIRYEQSASEKTKTKNTNDFGGRVFIGERMGNVGVEVGYTAHGTFKNDTNNQYGVGIGTFNAHSFDMSMLLYKGNFFGRVGVHTSQSEANTHTWTSGSDDTSKLNVRSTGPLVGFGWQKGMWRMEYIRYFNVGLTDVVGKHSIDSLVVSLVKEF